MKSPSRTPPRQLASASGADNRPLRARTAARMMGASSGIGNPRPPNTRISPIPTYPSCPISSSVNLGSPRTAAHAAISRRRPVMPSHDRRAAGRRRAWGRGPIILKLESLERRALMTADTTLPDLVNSALATSSTVADWKNTVAVEGRVTNQGGGTTTAPLQIALYASPIRGIDRYSVPIGEATIPAAVAAGQTVPYQTSVTLPTTPIPHVSST